MDGDGRSVCGTLRRATSGIFHLGFLALANAERVSGSGAGKFMSQMIASLCAFPPKHSRAFSPTLPSRTVSEVRMNPSQPTDAPGHCPRELRLATTKDLLKATLQMVAAPSENAQCECAGLCDDA